MPRPEFPVDVDRQLVWMTCGCDAGYQVLLAPAGSKTSWLEIFESAFPALEIGQFLVRQATILYVPAEGRQLHDEHHLRTGNVRHRGVVQHLDGAFVAQVNVG